MRSLWILLVPWCAGCSLLFETEPPGCEFIATGKFVDDSGASSYLIADCESGAGRPQAEAQAGCQILGGTLANIESAAEQEFLLGAVRGHDDFWMGLRYEVDAGFTWDESSSAVDIFCAFDGCSATLPVPISSSCFLIDYDEGGAWLPRDCDHDDDYLCEIKE